MELFLLLKGAPNRLPELPRILLEEYFDPDFIVRDEGRYRLYLNRKTLSHSCITSYGENGSAYGTGTFIYRSQGPEESLRLLLADFGDGRYDPASLLGHYFILLFLPSGIKILNDGTGLVKAYHDSNGSYLSSSFLLAARLHESLTLNRSAAAENLVTGGITGQETLVNEISSFSRDSAGLFSDIEFLIPERNSGEMSHATYADAMNGQAQLLKDYFRSCSSLAGTTGADIGLTGGYDSRLILACARDQFEDLQVHSHFRPAGSEEWRIARMIAEGEGIRFVSPEVTPPGTMDDEMMSRVLESSFRFNDGIISMHCNWMEEYNTLEYRLSVLGDKRLGLSGIGGEQYRNQDRLYGKPWIFDQWLKYSWVRRVSGKAFPDSRDEREILDRIKVKMYTALGFRSGKVFIDLADLKRIQNEIFIPAYRGARIDAENRYAWHLGPLADAHVAGAAAGIVRFLRDSKRFEAELIRTLSPSLAAYPTDYGYTLTAGEPASERILNSAFENMLPASLKWGIRERIRRGIWSGSVAERAGSSALLSRCAENVVSAGLPVSVPALLGRESTAHLVIALGYFLEKLKPSTGS
jgi:asparagine synthase (glutamine-hydrolysing)